ncbi:MAG: hypothetical protein B0W54_16175 [Cellvibrio sp. 79]|nr:MAG: hypothetical protein B0W54_16175 [Cellvibrio sp. 79]
MTRSSGILIVSLLLGACGGGGGGDATPIPASSAASSSSVGMCGTGGVIFESCLNTEWGNFGIWEHNIETNQGQSYKTETNSSNVQWAIVDSPSAGHGKVIEVSYGGKANYVSQLYVNREPVDRSEFATGKLSFDVNVLDFGDAYDRNKGSMQFEVVVECKWPCTSHSVKVPVSVLNQWQPVELSIAELVRGGLYLKSVDTGFFIRPSFEDGLQTGVKFQLDNIKWVKGTGSVSVPKEIFWEHFDSEAALKRWAVVNYTGMSPFSLYLTQGLSFYPVWQTDYDHFAVETNLPNAINIKNKKAKFQIKLQPSLVGVEGNIEFSLAATDGNGRTVETDLYTTQGMHGNQWYQIETALGGNFGNNFNPADVRALALHFYANNKPRYYFGQITIDTILITE